MINNDSHLSETYFVSSFLSGLSDDLRPMVKMISPRTVEQAAKCVKLQEIMVEALMKKQHKTLTRRTSSSRGKNYNRGGKESSRIQLWWEV